jgi:NAD(P)-dependent dehydrogenase (short-subunit alcohol dehydrogenase family)
MDLGIQGKRAFVSGSTAGIGYAVAETLAREGAAVIVNGRTPERVDKAVAAIRDATGNANVTGAAADVGTAGGCALAVSLVTHVDILVNNVGTFEPKPFSDIPDAEWFKYFEINVMSGVRLARAFLPQMLARNWGRIVFVSSESALNIPAEAIHYGMTKTAQLAVARGLAESTAGTGITVNSVLPGPTSSEGAVRFVKSMAESQGVSRDEVEKQFFQTMRPSSLLKRFTTPDEVAAMIVYVCSAQALATNGATLRVDGGVVRAIA